MRFPVFSISADLIIYSLWLVYSNAGEMWRLFHHRPLKVINLFIFSEKSTVSYFLSAFFFLFLELSWAFLFFFRLYATTPIYRWRICPHGIGGVERHVLCEPRVFFVIFNGSISTHRLLFSLRFSPADQLGHRPRRRVKFKSRPKLDSRPQPIRCA